MTVTRSASSTALATSTERGFPDPGMLPTWEVEQLPDPPKFSLRRALRMIGPGVILAGMAIGGGEWVLGFVLQPTGGDGCSRTALDRHDLDGKPGGAWTSCG